MDIKSIARTLLTGSTLEQNRVSFEHPDPRSIAFFKELEETIQNSFQKPAPFQKTLEKKAFQDHELVKKLVQHRHQYKTSGKIIRKKDP